MKIFFLIQKLQCTLFRQINTVGSFPLFTHFCRKKNIFMPLTLYTSIKFGKYSVYTP